MSGSLQVIKVGWLGSVYTGWFSGGAAADEEKPIAAGVAQLSAAGFRLLRQLRQMNFDREERPLLSICWIRLAHSLVKVVTLQHHEQYLALPGAPSAMPRCSPHH